MSKIHTHKRLRIFRIPTSPGPLLPRMNIAVLSLVFLFLLLKSLRIPYVDEISTSFSASLPPFLSFRRCGSTPSLCVPFLLRLSKREGVMYA